MELNPHQLHYFKRELISIQLKKELNQVKQHPEVISSLVKNADTNYPFLQFVIHRFILPFPLLQKADERQFWSKLETFLKEYGNLKLNNYAPKKIREDSQREVLLFKLEKLIVVSLTTIIKTTGQEESIHVKASEDPSNALAATHLTHSTDINIITVREVSQVRHIMQHTHSEFVVQSSHGCVSKKHSQFRTLRDELKLSFPTDEIPIAPKQARDASYDSKVACLYQEKDRLLLRSFLRKLCAIPAVAESDIFQKFLKEDPIQLNTNEQQDVEERKKMDETRAEAERKFKQQVEQKIVELDGLLSMLKQKAMQPNGLLELFEVIKTTSNIENLPDELKKAIEWGRINFAFALHTQFVTSDKSVENVASLKRTHSLMPYRAIASILKLSNPFFMVKSVLDLFLAQPFGGKSLFQRIILANLHEESKQMQKDIDDLEAIIKDPELCKKVAIATQTELKQDQVVGTEDPVTETLKLLNDSSIAPVLTQEQINKVALADQPGEEQARQLVLELYKLWVLYARKQEQETLTALVFQGVTGELMKDLFATFYEPLAEVYKAANIGETINHVSHFIEDLIKIIENLNVQDATNSTQPFIDLVKRHEQEFYSFVHNVHAQNQTKLFDQLLGYVDSIFALASHGLSARVNMGLCVESSEISPEEQNLLKEEIDSVCLYHTERKQRHLDRKRQKMISTNEQDILQEHREWSGIVDDFADIEDDSLLSSHEMNLKAPKLEWIPRVLPAFIEQVTHQGVLGLSVIP
ncbi:hypothetical protein BY458DRAFT_531674 [Sporodiniella umbellata]|nr:hypothetical protein BY458DRAFT_531674 [Sporodiniella umbellata]